MSALDSADFRAGHSANSDETLVSAPGSSSEIVHRESEYDSSGLEVLRRMQERHFWYRGRHRFLMHAFGRQMRRFRMDVSTLRVLDLGGGCGGWLKYLCEYGTTRPAELALADSATAALEYARSFLPEDIQRHQADLLDLPWHDRWDVIFLLDVLEHIPEDQRALSQVFKALAPGGLLFFTTPALQSFWSYNDDAVHHVRRYSQADFRRLAVSCGFECLDTRYFMFFLSPLLLATRWLQGRQVKGLTEAELSNRVKKSHEVPPGCMNALLTCVFSAETPLGHVLSFPFGTSVLGVFRKPT